MQPHSASFKAALLICTALITFVPSLVYHMLNVLQPVITETWNCSENSSACCSDCIEMGDDNYNVMFGLMYLVSILSVPVGFLQDKLGTAVTIGVSVSCMIGCSLIAIGSCVRESSAMLPLIFAGAAFFGFSYVMSYACRNRLCGFWFRDSGLQLAYGLTASITHFASLLSFTLTEKLREAIGLQWTLWCCVLVAAAGVLCTACATVLDAWGTRQLAQTQQLQEEQRSVRIWDLRHFGCEFWLLLCCYSCWCAALFTLNDNSVEMIHEKFAFSKEAAAVTAGFVQYIAIVGAPAVGLLLSAVGRSSFFLALATFLMLPALLLLAFCDIHPVLGAATAGVSYCFMNPAASGSLPLILPRRWLGTGFGLMLASEAALEVAIHTGTAAVLGRGLRLQAAQKRIRWQLATLLMLAATLVAFGLAASLSLLSWCRGGQLAAGGRRKKLEEDNGGSCDKETASLVSLQQQQQQDQQ